MDDLTKAIMAAGEELAREHQWCFDGDPGEPPTEDNPFVLVVRRHMLPLTDLENWRHERIKALKAEIEFLKG